MKVVIFLNIILLLFITLFTTKKRLHPFENIFLLLILEFIITSYVGILHINLEVWELSEKIPSYLIFRLNEVITTPLLYFLFFNLMRNRKKSILESIKLGIVFVLIIYSLEFLLVKWKIIIYKDWSIWQSLLIISFIMLISNFILLSFRKQLSKEGVKV